MLTIVQTLTVTLIPLGVGVVILASSIVWLCYLSQREHSESLVPTRADLPVMSRNRSETTRRCPLGLDPFEVALDLIPTFRAQA